MKIIIDSGSSKADCAIISHGKITQINTPGFNPYTHEITQLHNMIQSIRMQITLEADLEVYYYGAGIAAENAGTIKSEFDLLIKNNRGIHVHTDLLGAARAGAQHSEAIVAINGTGSNACIYDGQQIEYQINTLGYILGDEGSGSHLGKELIRDFFYHRLPYELEVEFHKTYPEITRASLLTRIYNDNNPNTYLATFAKFISERKEHIYVKYLIQKCFKAFIKAHILPLYFMKNYAVVMIGSIGYHFQDEWLKCFSEFELTCKLFIEKPIDGLIEYHMHS